MPDFTLARCHDDAIRETVERDHYLHRWPDPRSLPFGLILAIDGNTRADDGRPFGLVVWKKPQHHIQTGLFGRPGLPTSWQVLDLARVWVHPSLQGSPRPVHGVQIVDVGRGRIGFPVQRGPNWIGTNRKGEKVRMSLNVFSRMTSLALKRVQRDWIDHHPPVYPELPYHIRLIVSYCDRQHHQGTGYRAAGFDFFGETGDGTKDIYIRRLKEPRWSYESPQPKLLEVAIA